jgi:hypothetical protein
MKKEVMKIGKGGRKYQIENKKYKKIFVIFCHYED